MIKIMTFVLTPEELIDMINSAALAPTWLDPEKATVTIRSTQPGQGKIVVEVEV